MIQNASSSMVASIKARQAFPGEPRQVSDHGLAFADAMRTFAIFAVVLNHLLSHTGPQLGHLNRPLTLGFLGLWGVNCFFVLSGFLLGRPYVRALLDAKKKFPSTAQFYARRFFRIYPLYAASLAFSLLAAAWYAHKVPALADVASHVFLLQGFWTQTVLSISSPLWTMGIDAGFYIILPLVALLLAPLVRGRPLKIRAGIIVVALLMIEVAAIIYRYVQLQSHPQTLIPDFAAGVVYERNLIGMASTFAIGVLVALITSLPLSIPRAFCRFAIGAGMVIGIAELIYRIDKGGPDTTRTLLRMALADPIAALSCALILLGLAEGRFSAVRRAAASRVVVGAATLAYAVYLVHWSIIEGVQTILFHGAIGTRAFVDVSLVSLPIIFAVAYVAHRVVERPFLAIRDQHRETSTIVGHISPSSSVQLDSSMPTA
jgi:peptidoglycan/LPS O-acetylase OafA/YrhL